MKIHHVGILMGESYFALCDFLKLAGYSTKEILRVKEFQCTCVLLEADGSRIEIVIPYGGSLFKRLQAVGSGTHHIAFEVPDVREAAADMKSKGYIPLLKEPVPGIDNSLVNFLLPINIGTLFELVQKL